MSSSSQTYSPVSIEVEKDSFSDSDRDTLLGSDLSPWPKSGQQQSNSLRWHNTRSKLTIPLILNVLVLILNIAGMAYWSLSTPQYARTWAKFMSPQITAPSMAQEAVEHGLHRFTDPDDRSTPWSGEPSEEVDKAWEDLVDNGRSFLMTPEMFAEVNGHPETGVRLPGDPDGHFIGILEVTHQLHCVDIMRRGAWFNIEHYRQGQFFANKSDAAVIWHMRHCFEVLRQTIQCHGDSAMLTYNWIKDYPVPQSAWQSLHSCQNWEQLQEWRVRNDITPQLKYLDRPLWVLDPEGKVPGKKGAAEGHTHDGTTKAEQVEPVLAD